MSADPDPFDTVPGAETIALYRSMSTAELMTVGAAYQMDLQNPLLPIIGRHFAEGRLALIASILAQRGSPMPQ